MTDLNGSAFARIKVAVAACAGIRHRRGWTQDDLAVSLGRTRYHVRTIESGDPDPIADADDLYLYALACGCHVVSTSWSSSDTDLRGEVIRSAFDRDYRVTTCEELGHDPLRHLGELKTQVGTFREDLL